MIKEKNEIEDLNLIIKYNPGYQEYILIYVHSFEELNIEVTDNYVFVFITGNDWEKDFSPFKHPAVFKGGKDFIGQACEYIVKFKRIIDEVERYLNLNIIYRILSGYSLAGLFALYVTSKINAFDKICCCSASFWFPGFIEYVKNNQFFFKEAYFSIGNKESNTKNQYLSKSYEKMNEIKDILENNGKIIKFELNEGGHFNDCDSRIIKGIKFLLD